MHANSDASLSSSSTLRLRGCTETRSAEITPKRSGALETQKGGENSGHIWTVHVDTLTKTHKHTWYVSV